MDGAVEFSREAWVVSRDFELFLFWRDIRLEIEPLAISFSGHLILISFSICAGLLPAALRSMMKQIWSAVQFLEGGIVAVYFELTTVKVCFYIGGRL